MPYDFTADSFKKFQEDVIKAEGDQATLTTLLADMQGTFVEAIAKDATMTDKVSVVTAENERLRNANMELFLRVGQKAADDAGVSGRNQEPEEPAVGVHDFLKSYFDKEEK